MVLTIPPLSALPRIQSHQGTCNLLSLGLLSCPPHRLAVLLPLTLRLFSITGVLRVVLARLFPDRIFPLFQDLPLPYVICIHVSLDLCTYHGFGQPHKFATYGIVTSTAPSSDDESEDTLPRASLNAPIEALQGRYAICYSHDVPELCVEIGLANAAAEAAAASLNSSSARSVYVRLMGRDCKYLIPVVFTPVDQNY